MQKDFGRVAVPLLQRAEGGGEQGPPARQELRARQQGRGRPQEGVGSRLD